MSISSYASSLLLLSFAAASTGAIAQSREAPGGRQAGAAPSTVSSNLSPVARGELAGKFVSKWGTYVQRVYGVPVKVWAKRMSPNFATADAGNLVNALKRDTFEGAMAELNGVGSRITDTQVINKLAAEPAGGRSGATNVIPKSLGALSNDLVYTPVAPCRILDTRNVAAGAIAANATRNFVAFGVSSFASQGGSATNCGVNPLSATAVAINLTAVTPAAAGYATAYPFGTTRPVAASVNYVAGAIVNNALIVQTPNPISSFDFTVYTFAQSHYVADIVGYFAPPVATALQCLETGKTIVNIVPNGTANADAPACAAGYTATSTNCESSDWLVPFVFINNGTCSARNNSAGAQDIRASRTCCRVPGR